MKSTKKLLSLLLALVMIIGMMPMTALAEGSHTITLNDAEAFVNGFEATTANEGDEVIVKPKDLSGENKKFREWKINPDVTLTSGSLNSPTIKFTMPDQDITLTAEYDTITKYKLTVINGKGTTEVDLTENTSVSLLADDLSTENKRFIGWTYSPKTLFVEGADRPRIEFTMPAEDVTITANYEDEVPKTYKLTVNNGTGDGNHKAGTPVKINATVPSNKEFDKWVVEKGNIKAPTTAAATITMPAEEVIITAVFKNKPVDPYPTRPVIYSATVYSDRVTGTATPNAKVQLYRDGSAVSGKYTYADSRGNFEIKHDFEYYYRYYDKYNDKYYDRYNDRYYNRYYYRYSLIATKDGLTSSEYNLGDYWGGGGGYYYDPVYNKYPIITSALSGNTTLTGYGVNGYDKVTVKDNLGYSLGSVEADSRGEFKVYLNRALRQGEKLFITASGKYYRDRTTEYTVGGPSYVAPTGLFTQFTIGSKVYTRLIKGVTVTATMDVAPFIKNGRTMLPLRYVAESLGYDVSWNDATRIATFVKGSSVITVSIDSPVFKINGVEHKFSSTPITVNGRIMLSISELGMALGLTHSDVYGSNANIVWDAAAQKVTIKK